MRFLAENIAKVCHEANRAYAQILGDFSIPPWNEEREDIRKSVTLGVEKILSGEITKPEDSHTSWCKHKVSEGWKWGLVKDMDAKTHPCLVPFDQLPTDQQRKDHLFFNVVRALTHPLI